MKKATEGDAKLAVKGEAETSAKSLGAFQNQAAGWAQDLEASIVPYNEGPNKIFLLNLIKWLAEFAALESSSDSLTRLKEAVEAEIKRVSKQKGGDVPTMYARSASIGTAKWFLKLIEEREQAAPKLEVWCAICQHDMRLVTGENVVKGWYRCDETGKHAVIISEAAAKRAEWETGT